MLAIVDVDPENFVAKVRKISALEDCGRVLDQQVVLGQLRGGIVMGIGDAILEEHIYSDDGEILTSSFMDEILVPTVSEAPEFDLALADDPRLFTARSDPVRKGLVKRGRSAPWVPWVARSPMRSATVAVRSTRFRERRCDCSSPFNGHSATDIAEVMS